jgi:hypothetical protein
MGHTRLNSLPNTAPWRKVVTLLAEGADLTAVADATYRAAIDGLDLAFDDDGLVESLYLYTRITLASRQPSFVDALAAAGISIPIKPTVFDIVAGFTRAVDARLGVQRGRNDLSELAQLAATESLSRQLSSRASNLFEVSEAEVLRAARGLSTQVGFATLAHDFFACFTRRFLAYHLGRELSNHVGGNGRFASPTEHNEFSQALDTHCREAAAVMREYAGDWYSKHNFLGGITRQKARAFANHALKKLRHELGLREAHLGA